MNRQKSRYYRRLLDIKSRGLPIDPLSGELGTFNSRLTEFKEPIEELINPYSGKPYETYLYPKIAELRLLFIEWQKVMNKNLDVDERPSYLLDDELIQVNNEKIVTYLKNGFRFNEFADEVGLSAATIRNRFKQKDYLQRIDNPPIEIGLQPQIKRKKTTIVNLLRRRG